MAIQTVELQGERYVIVPEQEFLKLQGQLSQLVLNPPDPQRSATVGFREIVPLRVTGVAVSEIMIQDRR